MERVALEWKFITRAGPARSPGDSELADEKIYQAEYQGSGTFIISKPKRKRHKARQTKVKNPQRGARK